MKYGKQFFIIFFLLVIGSVPVCADGNHPKGIKTDGTLGNAGALDLPGPNYDIRAEYGQQAGANLFHSFQQFNIHSGESTTFTGPDSVRNIISRVTGGSASWIDGKLGSAIPGTDLYLLNPVGVMFGRNAALDLSGSFHISTADYLRLGENDRFYSTPHAYDVLSLAAPAAFGFLDGDISPITFEGGEISDPDDENHALIRVPEGRSVSVIGGDIEMKGIFYRKQATDEHGNPVFKTVADENGEPLTDDQGNPVLAADENGDPIAVMETVRPANISAPQGRISMAAVASAGEIIPSDEDLNADPFEKMRNISLSDKAKIDASGDGGGSIFIRGGEFLADDSDIHVKTLNDKDGGVVDIHADRVSLTSGSRVIGNTEARGSDIVIRANESVTVSGENSNGRTSAVLSESRGTADVLPNHTGMPLPR